MTWATAAEAAGTALLVLGATLTLVAAISVSFFRDLLSRMHAAAKPQVLGLTLMMAGLALVVQDSVVAWTLVLVVAFQFITAPISAHMVGRAGYRTGKVDPDHLVVDELTEDLAAAQRSAEGFDGDGRTARDAGGSSAPDADGGAVRG
ncbi:monovalent cation/H(+) antiporter subunit G [Georgenia sp. TF02-10]|uniref:monovalent cation/H(+) antiporter subunit G n=1 Tax=Georgenia sp. TF02-10 TaxID=2917725 RepID=UPI001FA80CB0|nr:monovalent cation/H(+) antiporter subunit G [Georgenia sp. TF02-10]UNX54670.1 monovalent cation/H(+) antiporter subunit G [Georgenia sp. TF02-10]